MRHLLSLSALILAKHSSPEHPKNGSETTRPQDKEPSETEAFGSAIEGKPSADKPVDPSPDPIRVKPEDKPVEILNKIVAKDIVKRSMMVYQKEVKVDAEGHETVKVINPAPRALYRVFGTARDVKHGDSQFGEWTAFIGSFEAIRFSDRQRFQAPNCFLQGASEGLLLDALLAARKQDSSATVMFAFDIGVKPSDKWVAEDKGNSYEYTVRTVLKTEQHDPLKEIRALAMDTLPSLPAPTE
jgi:hypothetical protein